MNLKKKSLDLLALSSQQFSEWLQEANPIHQKLFGRPLHARYRSRDNAVFFRTEQYYDGDKLIGHSILFIFEMVLFDPLKGKVTNVLLTMGGGGTLSPYIGRFKVYLVVPKSMARFHLTKPRKYRQTNTFLFSPNVNPLSSYILGRHFPMVHPYPGRTNEPFEQMSRELVQHFYPEQMESYLETGVITGPSFPLKDEKIRVQSPLLRDYMQMHRNWQEGDRLPMICVFNLKDIVLSLLDNMKGKVTKRFRIEKRKVWKSQEE